MSKERSSGLTIGIPAFNEINHLPKTLESILMEISNISNTIELIVADNGSKDGTTEYLEEFMKRATSTHNVKFKLIKQGENKGFNYNCDSLISASTGEYLWILGAQEILLPGALSEIFKNLAKKPRQLVFNAEVWDEATESLANPRIYGERPDIRYDTADTFYLELGGPCRSISLNIVRTDLMKQSLGFKLTSHYWGLYERHAFASIIECKETSYLFLNRPIVRILIEKSGWQLSGEDDFGTKVVKRTFPGFYADIEMAEIGLNMLTYGENIGNSIGVWRDRFGLVRTFSTAKCNGLRVNFKLLSRCISVYKRSYWFWILGLPILLTPNLVLNPSSLERARKLTHLVRKILHKPPK